eukprot:tig00000881_g5233.t1
MDGKRIKPKKKGGGDGASENGGGSKNGGGSQASHGSGVSGTSSKNNGGLLGMADYLYTAQDMIFGVVFLMMKETERKKWLAIAEIVAFNLWFLFFPLTVFTYGRFAPGSAFVPLGEAMSYPFLRYWDYTDYSVVYWVSVVLVLLVTANLAFVTWIFQRQKFRFKDPIVYLRYWANACTSWLAAPLLLILSQVYNCPLSGGRHVNFPQLECWSMAHIPLVVIAAVASLALVIFTLSMAVFYYEPDPRKEHVFTARPHTRADFIAQVALYVMCIEYSITILPEWVFGATYLVAGLAVLWSMLQMFPYYCQWVNYVRIGVASTFTWCAILVLAESQYAEWQGNNLTLAFILGGLAAPALGVAFARWRFHTRYCTGALEGLEMKKPWHVELATRFLLEDRSQQSLELAEDIFLEGVDRYQTSANVYVCYSNYLYWARGSEQLAFDKARQASKLKPLPDHAFYIYCKMNQRTQSMQGGGGKGGPSGASDMLSFIEFQKNFSGAKKYHRHAVRSFKKFWMMLLTEETDMRQLEAAVSRIDRFESRAQNFYRNLLSKHPNNPRILRAYGKFHEEVLNDVLSAQDFYDAADEFEDANVVATIDMDEEEEEDMDHELGQVVTTQKVVGNIFEQARAEQQQAVTVVSKGGGSVPVRSALKGGRADVTQLGGWAADTTFEVPDPNAATKKTAREPKDPLASSRHAKEHKEGEEAHHTHRGEGHHTHRTDGHATARSEKRKSNRSKHGEELEMKDASDEEEAGKGEAAQGEEEEEGEKYTAPKAADQSGIDLMHGFGTEGVGRPPAKRRAPTSTQMLIAEAKVELAASEETRAMSAQGGSRAKGARTSPRRSLQTGEGLKTSIIFDGELVVQDVDMYFSVVFGHDEDVRGRPLGDFLPAFTRPKGAPAPLGGLPGAANASPGPAGPKRSVASVLGEEAYDGAGALKNALARRDDGSTFLAALEPWEMEVGDSRLYQVTVRRAEGSPGSRPSSRSAAAGGGAQAAAVTLLAVPEHSRPASVASSAAPAGPTADPPQWQALQRPSIAASENGLESLLADLRANSDAANAGGAHVLSKWGLDEEDEEEDSGAGTGTGQGSHASRDSDIVVPLSESTGLKQRKKGRPGSSGSDSSFKKPLPIVEPAAKPVVAKPTAAALAALAGGGPVGGKAKAKGSDAGGSDDEHAHEHEEEGKGGGSDKGSEEGSGSGSEEGGGGEEAQQRAKRRLKKLNALKRRVAAAHTTHNTAIKRMRRVVYLVLIVLAGAALLGYFFIKNLLDTYMLGIQLVGDTGGRRRTGNMAVYALRSVLLHGHPEWDPEKKMLQEWAGQLEANLDRMEENHLHLSDFFTKQDFSVRRILSDGGETGMAVDDMWNAGFEIVDAGRRALDRIRTEGIDAVRKNRIHPQAGLDDPDIYFLMNNTIERIRLKFIEAADITVDAAESLFGNIRTFLYIEICLVTVLIVVLALGFFRPTILRVQGEKERALLLFYEIPRATVARMAGLGKKSADDEDEEDMDDDDFDDDFEEMDAAKAGQGGKEAGKEKERSAEDKAKHIRERMQARKRGVDAVTIKYTVAFFALFAVFLAWFVVSYVYSAKCYSFARERNLSGLRRSTPAAMQYYARELIFDPDAYDFNLEMLKKHTHETEELERGLLYGSEHLKLPGSAMRFKAQDELMFGKPCASDPKGCTNSADNGVHRLLMRFIQEATFLIDSPRELLTPNNTHLKYMKSVGLEDKSQGIHGDLDLGLRHSVTIFEEEAKTTVGEFLLYHQMMMGLTFLTIVLSYLLVFRVIVSALNDESRRTTFLMLMVPPEVIESCDSIRAYLLSRM